MLFHNKTSPTDDNSNSNNISFIYLRRSEQDTEDPGSQQHPPVPPAGIQSFQRVQDCMVPVQTHHHQDKRCRMHGKKLEEAKDLAHGIAGIPLHCDIPYSVEWHHHKSHDQVSGGQTGNERPQVRGQVASPSPGHADQH